jgi:hypothetical protein
LIGVDCKEKDSESLGRVELYTFKYLSNPLSFVGNGLISYIVFPRCSIRITLHHQGVGSIDEILKMSSCYENFTEKMINTCGQTAEG